MSATFQGMEQLTLPRLRAAETKRRRSRAAILEAATRLFRDHGWLPSTIESIAKEAGVGTATVYNHFANKNILAGYVFLPLVKELLEDPRWGDGSIPPKNALRDFVSGLSVRTRADTPLTIALLEAVNDSTARHGTQINADDPRSLLPLPQILTNILDRGQDTGEFRAYPPASEAGPLFFNLLMLRVITRPAESALETSRLILTVIERTYSQSLAAGEAREGASEHT